MILVGYGDRTPQLLPYPRAEHLQQITHPSPQYQKIDVLVMEVLQQITIPIPITYKFLVITKTHLSLRFFLTYFSILF